MDRLAFMQGAETVGDEAIFAPVATADGVSRTGGCHSHMMGATVGFLRKEGFDVGGRHQLGAAFTGAVGIMAAHGIIFPVAHTHSLLR